MNFAGSPGGSGRPSVKMLRHQEVLATHPQGKRRKVIFSGGRMGDEIHVALWDRRPLSLAEARAIGGSLIEMAAEIVEEVPA